MIEVKSLQHTSAELSEEKLCHGCNYQEKIYKSTLRQKWLSCWKKKVPLKKDYIDHSLLISQLENTSWVHCIVLM